MIPTGFEYDFLTDVVVSELLRKLLIKLKSIWPNVYVEVGPNWELHRLEEWIASPLDYNSDFAIYFSSHKAGFDVIEEQGLSPNTEGYDYFMLESTLVEPVNYFAEVFGKVDEENMNFGEFSCEIYLKRMSWFTITLPDETKPEENDIVMLVRNILRNNK